MYPQFGIERLQKKAALSFRDSPQREKPLAALRFILLRRPKWSVMKERLKCAPLSVTWINGPFSHYCLSSQTVDGTLMCRYTQQLYGWIWRVRQTENLYTEKSALRATFKCWDCNFGMMAFGGHNDCQKSIWKCVQYGPFFLLFWLFF